MSQAHYGGKWCGSTLVCGNLLILAQLEPAALVLLAPAAEADVVAKNQKHARYVLDGYGLLDGARNCEKSAKAGWVA